MEGAEIAQLINELETRVERLRALYDQYFVGIERLEPLVLRKDVDRRLWILRREQIRNTALRFKLETTIQRYNTYQQYWQRIVREIENGTYQRDLGRAMKRFGDLGTTALGKRRQKMFEKGMARRAEREAGRSSAPPPSDSQAPPGPSNPPGETPISNGPPRVPSPPPPPAGAAPAEEWEDVDLELELELQSSRPPPPLAAEPAAAAKPVAAIPAAAPPPRIAISTGAQAPPSAASSPLPQRGPAAPAAPAPARVGAASTVAKPQAATPAKPMPPAAKAAILPVAKPAAAPVAKPAATPLAKPATAAAKPQPQVPAGTSKPHPAGPPATAPAPVAAAQKPAAAKPPAAQPAASTDDLSAGRMRQIYGQYVEAKRRANESTAALTYEKVAANLQQTAQTLRAKHGSQSVDFEVVLKNGKPAIKPILKG